LVILNKKIMAENNKYNINLDVKYNHLELIDVPEIVRECKEKWFNWTLTQVNDSVVRIGIVEGEFHWHKHDNDDEFFFVLDGKLFIDIENRTIELNPNQGATISKGIMHRPRATQKTIMLMVENKEIIPTGD
jgi:mannose-6-phosphate isomerase-like protein (cupin superfamily)